jgi:hypothetical protein
MDPNAATEYLQSIAASAAAGRLIYLGLGRRFPALLAYAFFVAVLNFAFGAIDRYSKLYFWTYIAIGPLENIFSILVVRELLNVMFEHYPGIRTVVRWALYLGIVLSTGTSVALTKLFWNTGARHRTKWRLLYFEVVQRSIVFTLVVVIIAILFVLSKYPLRLSRNTYLSYAFFSGLFLTEAVRLLIDGMTRALYTDLVDWTASVTIALCLGSWAFLLRPEPAPAARVAFSTPREDQLLHQLDSLNQIMSRAARR